MGARGNMDAIDFNNLFLDWAKQSTAENPYSAAESLIILQRLLLFEVTEAETSFEVEDNNWQKALENALALVTFSPLAWFQEDLKHHENELVAALASIAQLKRKLGFIPEFDEPLTNYFNQISSQRLLARMKAFNETESGSEAQRLWTCSKLEGGYLSWIPEIDKYELANSYVN